MHLAVALNRPVVGVFGPTNPTWVGPYRRPESVVRMDLPCSPCYFRRLSQCPNDHACMKLVSAEQVIERVRAILAGAGHVPLAGDGTDSFMPLAAPPCTSGALVKTHSLPRRAC